jgi:two-component system nitrate/nitrite response regulator NarP
MTETTLSKAMSAPDLSPQNASATRQQPTQIAVIGHDDFSVRSVASMLGQCDGSYVVSCVEGHDKGLAALEEAGLDILLIQGDSVPQPAEPFLGDISERFADARVLVFGRGMDDEELYRLLCAGIHGYIDDRTDSTGFRRALEQIMAGELWVERRILQRFVERRQRPVESLAARYSERIDQLCDRLTRREIEILGEVVRGLAIKQIAERVHLSHQGVKMHLAKLFRKFNVTNRNQLILAVFEEISPLEGLSALLCDDLNDKLRSRPVRH